MAAVLVRGSELKNEIKAHLWQTWPVRCGSVGESTLKLIIGEHELIIPMVCGETYVASEEIVNQLRWLMPDDITKLLARVSDVAQGKISFPDLLIEVGLPSENPKSSQFLRVMVEREMLAIFERFSTDTKHLFDYFHELGNKRFLDKTFQPSKATYLDNLEDRRAVYKQECEALRQKVRDIAQLHAADLGWQKAARAALEQIDQLVAQKK